MQKIREGDQTERKHTCLDWFCFGLDLIFPPVCCFCQKVCRPVRPYPGICRNCLSKLPLRFGTERQLDRLPLQTGQKLYLSAVLCAAYYQSPIREALLRQKFADSPEMSVALGSLLVPLIKHLSPRPSAVAAVPLHEERLRERGYNQAGLLAEQVSQRTGLANLSPGLIRTRKTLRQSEVPDRQARQANVDGAFSLDTQYTEDWLIQNPMENRHIVLIDDVLTTGATIEAAAQPLAQAGFRVTGLVVASDQGFLIGKKKTN